MPKARKFICASLRLRPWFASLDCSGADSASGSISQPQTEQISPAKSLPMFEVGRLFFIHSTEARGHRCRKHENSFAPRSGSGCGLLRWAAPGRFRLRDQFPSHRPDRYRLRAAASGIRQCSRGRERDRPSQRGHTARNRPPRADSCRRGSNHSSSITTGQ